MSSDSSSIAGEKMSEESKQSEAREDDEPSRVQQSPPSSMRELNASKELGENTQLSQSLQSLIAELQSSEEALQQESLDVQEAMETCERQQENLSELRCRTEQINLQYNDELKKKEALEVKYGKTVKMIQDLGVECNSVAYSLKETVADSETHKEVFNNMKTVSEQMQSSLGKIKSDSLPSTIEKLKKQLIYLKERHRLFRIESTQQINLHASQSELELKLAREKLGCLNSLSQELNVQTIASNEKIVKLEKAMKASSQDRQMEKESLLHRVELAAEQITSVQRDIQSVEEERTQLNSDVQRQQSKILQEKEREKFLENYVKELKQCVNELSESQSQNEAYINNVAAQIEKETNKTKMHQEEIANISQQLLEVENQTKSRVAELSEELQRTSSNAVEVEMSLQQELDDARVKESDSLKEEEDLKLSLVHLQDQLQELSGIKSEVIQSNKSLDKDLETVALLTKELTEKKKSLDELLCTERDVTQMKEESLLKMRAIHNESICELHHQLTHSEQEKLAVDKELESAMLTESALLCKIKEVQRDGANTRAEIISQKENIIRELQEQLSSLQNQMESIPSDFDRESSKLKQHLSFVHQTVESKNTELNSINSFILKCQSELEIHENSLKACMETKEIKEELMDRLAAKLRENSLKLDLINEEEERISLKLDEEKLQIEDADNKISVLELKYKNLQSDFEKSTADTESEKQVFIRDFVKFEQIRENRSNEIKVLEKQLNVWKDKIEDLQAKIKETACTLGSVEENAKSGEAKAQELENSLAELKQKKAALSKELTQAERDAGFAKKKVDHLRNKIVAWKESKRKQTEHSSQAFKVPNEESIPSRSATPQRASSSGDNKENSPHSILKTVPKAPTPQDRKNVSFQEDFNDSASSCSSIMMGPELLNKLEKNPALVHIVAAQHRERHLAAKRMKMGHSQDACASTSPEASTHSASPSKKIFSDEISSSTPENQPSDVFNWP